jgi:hypothetical protein
MDHQSSTSSPEEDLAPWVERQTLRMLGLVLPRSIRRRQIHEWQDQLDCTRADNGDSRRELIELVRSSAPIVWTASPAVVRVSLPPLLTALMAMLLIWPASPASKTPRANLLQSQVAAAQSKVAATQSKVAATCNSVRRATNNLSIVPGPGQNIDRDATLAEFRAAFGIAERRLRLLFAKSAPASLRRKAKVARGRANAYIREGHDDFSTLGATLPEYPTLEEFRAAGTPTSQSTSIVAQLEAAMTELAGRDCSLSNS